MVYISNLISRSRNDYYKIFWNDEIFINIEKPPIKHNVVFKDAVNTN